MERVGKKKKSTTVFLYSEPLHSITQHEVSTSYMHGEVSS